MSRPLRWLLPFALLLAAVAATPGADAACARPELTVSPKSAAPGSLVTVRGQHWFKGCNDTGRGGAEPADKPLLRLEQAGRTFDLGRAATERNYRFVKKVRLPALLLPVDAVIVGDGRGFDPRATVRITYTD